MLILVQYYILCLQSIGIMPSRSLELSVLVEEGGSAILVVRRTLLLGQFAFHVNGAFEVRYHSSAVVASTCGIL